MKINDKEFLTEMFSHYDFNINQYVGYRVISRGHINTTFILYFDYGNKVKRYLLQEINTSIFVDPTVLMGNIEKVTKFSKSLLKSYGVSDYKNKILRIYLTKDDNAYVKLTDGSCWRVYHYIENSVTYDTSTNPAIFYEAGQVIGGFQNILSTFETNELGTILEDFHNTKKRYARFEFALKNASKELKDTCKEEIEFYKSHSYIASIIQQLIDSKQMPLRVTHNDTKLNNIMFEYGTNKGQCLVDLDTVMPGCLCFDYGDFVRSACNAGEEDAKDLNTVVFQKDLCIEFTKGFLDKLAHRIKEIEIKNLIVGAIDMTYECGMRFLTDYLEGNVYFKVNYPEHNLIRSRTQISMCKQILECQKELEEIVFDIYKKLK